MTSELWPATPLFLFYIAAAQAHNSTDPLFDVGTLLTLLRHHLNRRYWLLNDAPLLRPTLLVGIKPAQRAVGFLGRMLSAHHQEVGNEEVYKTPVIPLLGASTIAGALDELSEHKDAHKQPQAIGYFADIASVYNSRKGTDWREFIHHLAEGTTYKQFARGRNATTRDCSTLEDPRIPLLGCSSPEGLQSMMSDFMVFTPKLGDSSGIEGLLREAHWDPEEQTGRLGELDSAYSQWLNAMDQKHTGRPSEPVLSLLDSNGGDALREAYGSLNPFLEREDGFLVWAQHTPRYLLEVAALYSSTDLAAPDKIKADDILRAGRLLVTLLERLDETLTIERARKAEFSSTTFMELIGLARNLITRSGRDGLPWRDINRKLNLSRKLNEAQRYEFEEELTKDAGDDQKFYGMRVRRKNAGGIPTKRFWDHSQLEYDQAIEIFDVVDS